MESLNDSKIKLISSSRITEKRNFLPIIKKKIKSNTTNNINVEDIFNTEKKRNRSIRETQIQQGKISEWLEADKKYLNTNISLKEIEKFVSGDFKISQINNEKRIKQKIKEKSNLEINNNTNNKLDNSSNNLNAQQNIILKNKIIKLEEPIFNLRSLGLEVKINFLMAGESQLFIFSRGKELLTNEMAVLYINKELDSSRKFINFAIIEENNLDENYLNLKTLKKQEIPKMENYIKNLDICEVSLTFVDNGDNKCIVYIDNENEGNYSRHFIFIADFYVPNIEISNIMLGATGDLISLRSMKLKQTPRNVKFINKDEYVDKTAQSCTCCTIF